MYREWDVDTLAGMLRVHFERAANGSDRQLQIIAALVEVEKSRQLRDINKTLQGIAESLQGRA